MSFRGWIVALVTDTKVTRVEVFCFNSSWHEGWTKAVPSVLVPPLDISLGR